MVHQSRYFSVQFSSVTQSCPTLCNPVDCSPPGLPVHHQLRKFTQTHVHWVGDAIQPSHPLWSPSPAFSFSQHQGLFQWVSSSHQVSKVLEFQLQYQSFQWIFRTDFPLGWTGWISLQSKGLSRVSSNTTVQKFLLRRVKKMVMKFCDWFSSVVPDCPWSGCSQVTVSGRVMVIRLAFWVGSFEGHYLLGQMCKYSNM